MSTTTTSAGPSAQEQLAGLVRALWQAVVRATRAAEQLPALPEVLVPYMVGETVIGKQAGKR